MVPSQSFLGALINNGTDDVIDMNLKIWVPKCKVQMVLSMIEIKEYLQTPTEQRYIWFLKNTDFWSNFIMV